MRTQGDKKILAVETSCDDTSTAIVQEDGFVIFNETLNQDSVHQSYGGVVPELAGRNHARHLLPLIEKAGEKYDLQEIDYLAVTNRPGLVGSLMVGMVTVKTLSYLLEKPWTAINHIEGHILSPFLWDKDKDPSSIEFPLLALIVSGGHTHLFKVEDFGKYTLLAHTVDDAAGETLDKVARVLGLNRPGGAEIDRLAQNVSPLGEYPFPKVKLKKNNLNFSFSGLKTAAVQWIKKANLKENPDQIPLFCADFQSAVVEQIIDRLDKAFHQENFRNVIIAGGVSANSLLRKKADKWAKDKNIKLVLPLLKYCTDNAAMIGLAGLKFFQRGGTSAHQGLNCFPRFLPEDF